MVESREHPMRHVVKALIVAAGVVACIRNAAHGEPPRRIRKPSKRSREPHLPFVAPKPYSDRYNPARLTLPSTTKLPDGAPAFASNDPAELCRSKRIPKHRPPVTDAEARRLIHGYHACVN